MYDGQHQAEADGVPFYYGITEAVFIGIYCMGARKCGWTKAPADVSFWTMVSTSYEVIKADKEEKQHVTEISQSSPAEEGESADTKKEHSDEELVTSYLRV